MFSVASYGNQAQQNVDWQRHCILVAASNPHISLSDKNTSDAEAVARSFAQCSVSLSIICPKQLPKHRSIYNAGKTRAQECECLNLDATLSFCCCCCQWKAMDKNFEKSMSPPLPMSDQFSNSVPLQPPRAITTSASTPHSPTHKEM